MHALESAALLSDRPQAALLRGAWSLTPPACLVSASSAAQVQGHVALYSIHGAHATSTKASRKNWPLDGGPWPGARGGPEHSMSSAARRARHQHAINQRSRARHRPGPRFDNPTQSDQACIPILARAPSASRRRPAYHAEGGAGRHGRVPPHKRPPGDWRGKPAGTPPGRHMCVVKSSERPCGQLPSSCLVLHSCKRFIERALCRLLWAPGRQPGPGRQAGAGSSVCPQAAACGGWAGRRPVGSWGRWCGRHATRSREGPVGRDPCGCGRWSYGVHGCGRGSSPVQRRACWWRAHASCQRWMSKALQASWVARRRGSGRPGVGRARAGRGGAARGGAVGLAGRGGGGRGGGGGVGRGAGRGGRAAGQGCCGQGGPLSMPMPEVLTCA